ncbi:MAG: CARDB domain-containing protein [Chloroflexota bacterium]|nr:CARDB domain-containing protein [Chloroflexota bacterium]
MQRPRSVLTFVPITTMITLLALGCSSAPVPSIAPTFTTPNLPAANQPANPPNNPVKIPENPGNSSAIVIDSGSVSLQPIAMNGWASPLIVASTAGATESSLINPNGQIYISWAITNQGPGSANAAFSIDLLLDGVPVERWGSKGLFADQVQSVRDWDLLPTRTHLSAGLHTLSLVVDSTNYVLNNDGKNNTYSVTFEWPNTLEHIPDYEIAPERLPNLSGNIPHSWSEPISITGIPIQDDPTVAASDPSFQLSYANSGFSSIHDTFLVYAYLDDVLVAKFSQEGLVPGEIVVTPSWRKLLDTIHLTKGIHTLTIQLDPTNLISEADETDNTISTTFNWGQFDPLEPSVVGGTLPGYPTIIPYTPTGWSGPLIISNSPGWTGALGPIYNGNDTFVSWAIQNTSVVPLKSPITIELQIGETIAHVWQHDKIESGELLIMLDEQISFVSEPGVFEVQLRLRTGPGNEKDSPAIGLVSKNAGWRSGIAPTSETPLLTSTEITRRINSLDSLRSSHLAPTHSNVQFRRIHSVIEAVYQTVHGKHLRDEPVSINILTEEEFTQWVDLECTDVANTLTQTARVLYLNRCEVTKGYIGYHTSWRGVSRIVVKGDRPPMQVLSTIAHELGHFRQTLINPQLNNLPNLDVLALREAQAYAYQVLFFRTLELLSGLDLLLYPQMTGYETFVEDQLAAIKAQVDTSEHARGQLVLWLGLLADPNLRNERTVLLNNLSIPAETASAYFDYLINFTPTEARRYVQNLMEGLSLQFGAIEEIALARLIPELPYWTEGSPALREIGLLMP